MLASITLAWALLAGAGAAAPAPPDDARALEATAFERGREGRLAAGTMLLERLLRERPESPRACLWAEGLLLNAIRSGDDRAMQRAMTELVARWRAQAPAGKQGDTLRRVCRDDVAHGLRYLASRWHNEGALRCDDELLERAEWAYREYLRNFSLRPGGDEMEFYLAELYMHRGQLAYRLVPCGFIVCGNWARAERERRRAAGLEAPRCGTPSRPEDNEPAYCPWYRRAAAAFRRSLELNPQGRFVRDAAYAQVAINVALTDWGRRNNADHCRVNAEGRCVVPARRCVEADCARGEATPRRYPTPTLSGVARVLPPPRTP
ncbi:MAG: hypothetical protein H6713_12260 [Myxococcales bacterium]|nr:hypothetical protein [Myxococcales bacterium]